ncbi:hypothetical protein DFH06DRAFT_997187 [Mycena polygramma]|nr:hypothetical protein DFH06DRAFT_997187 [Mycena polygramma]
MAPKKVCTRLPPPTCLVNPFQRLVLTGEELKAAEERWQKDAKQIGQATCPVCGLELKYGPGGIVNLIGQHEDTGRCDEAKLKRDKKPRKDGTVLSFFAKKVDAVPPTVQKPSLVISRSIAPTNPAPITSKTSAAPAVTAASISSTVPTLPLLGLMRQLRDAIRCLPPCIPDADGTGPLAVFSGDPSTYVGKEVEAESLWEELGPLFHKAFGYGTGAAERKGMIQPGPLGLGGFMRFMDHFVVERGLEGAMVELKLEQLLDLEDHGVTVTDAFAAEEPQQPAPRVIIDVDAETDIPQAAKLGPQAAKLRPQIDTTACAGFVLPGTLDYPFALHKVRTLPWGFEYINGVLTLRSVGCQRTTSSGRSNCRSCAGLAKESTLQGIINRAEDGVHENANYAYHGFSGLTEMLHRKNKRIEELRLKGLSIASRVITQARSLSDYKRLVTAIGSGAVERVDRVVGIALGRKRGVRGILRVYDDAGRGYYHPKSFTEEDDMRGILIWKLAGNRVSDIVHRSLGLPSRSTLRTRETVPPLVPSAGKPQKSEVAQNVQSCFEGIAEVLTAKKVVHQVLMFDEIATEQRIRWDDKTNNFLGVCRAHGSKVSLQFNGEQDADELFRALSKTEGREAEVHYAGEATVAALGLLSDETRLYAARPILISGDCKKETGSEHAKNVITPTIEGVNSHRELTKLRIVSVASDGESRRGKAFIEKTFIRELSPSSNIYSLLKDLALMNFWVGDDDLTPDKDGKHIFKRGRNRLLRKAGTDVMGVEITTAIIRTHLQSAGHSSAHIHSHFNPEDKQNVTLAFQLLQDIWSLPPPPENCSPGFRAARRALDLLGSLFYHLIFPYLCVDLTLSEQLEHLSAAAHLALLLYRDGGKRSLPTLLYIDIMIMIKNAYFCIAKAKVDDPNGKFWIILLGTDRLEALFGILRTMIGNDANLDILQLVGRLTSTTQVANILAKYPHWDRAPRRLNLPAMTRDSRQLSDKTDHIQPPSWRGDVSLQNVTPLTCWRRGRRIIEEDFPLLAPAFKSLDADKNVDILSPRGTLLVRVDLDPDDNEDEDEPTIPTPTIPTPTPTLSTDLEDALVDEGASLDQLSSTTAVNHFITVDKKPLRKTRVLSLIQKHSHSASSTDRLRRVAAVARFAITQSVQADIQIGVETLQERAVTVHFQIVRVVPATHEDDPDLKNDWRARGVIRYSITAPGRLVLPIDPVLSTRIVNDPFYLFESSVLRAFGARLLNMVTLPLNTLIPKFVPTESFPYRETHGGACFICEGDDQQATLLETDPHVCPKCTPSLPLDMAHPQTILAHVGAHILHDPSVDRSSQPCGLCCQPWPMCQFFLKKSGSAAGTLTLNMATSRGCPNLVYFSYGTAETYKESSPCSNVPLRCSHCNPKDPAVWRYNFKQHLIQHHPTVALAPNAHIWELCNAEKAGILKVWEGRNKRKKTKQPKPTLVISQAHSSRLALAYVLIFIHNGQY